MESTSVQSGDPFRSLYEDHLDEIERVVSWIVRRCCLVGDDAEEFRSWVHVKLMDSDFRILRSHSGRGSLATFLVAVVQNLARDYKAKHWGRWRPSAAAERLGVTAIQLETLVERDGFSLQVAIEMLRQHHGVRMSESEFRALAERLPTRESYALEGGERVEAVAGSERTEGGLMRSEGEATMEQAREALEECLAEFDLEERLMLRMHYESGLTVAAIATTLDIPQRQLYTRRERCLRLLRRSLENRGLESEKVFEALRWTEDERKLDFRVSSAEGGELKPSNSSRNEETTPE